MHGLFCTMISSISRPWLPFPKLLEQFMFWSYSSTYCPSSLCPSSLKSFTAGLLQSRFSLGRVPVILGGLIASFSASSPPQASSESYSQLNRKLDKYVPIFLTRSLHTGWKLFWWLEILSTTTHFLQFSLFCLHNL